MAKFRDVFYINDDEWKVKFVRTLGYDERNKQILGLCDPGDYTISVLKSLPFDDQMRILAHEIIHAFEFSWVERFPSFARILTHKFIAKFEVPLQQFILDNLI